jgi:hypothetical protein
MENRIIFQYDPDSQQFIFPSFPSDRQKFQNFIRRTHVLLSEVNHVVDQVNSCKDKRQSSENIDFKLKYSQAVRILFVEIFLILTFMILMIAKVYYLKQVKLEIVAFPLLIVALVMNFIIVVMKGKVNFKCSKKKRQNLPNAIFRNEIFNVLHSYNKKNTYGLEWKIMDRGKYLELSEKPPNKT